jgi:hypothetical protein
MSDKYNLLSPSNQPYHSNINIQRSIKQEEDDDSDLDHQSKDTLQRPTRKRISSSAVCQEAQVVLLQSILSPQGDQTYSSLLDQKPNWFGERQSKLRKRIHSRRNYLKQLQQQKPEHFLSICQNFGVRQVPVSNTFEYSPKLIGLEASTPDNSFSETSYENHFRYQPFTRNMQSPNSQLALRSSHGASLSRSVVVSREVYSIKFGNQTDENPYNILL